ncbi:FAD/NAD(P)-binding protein [Nitrospirillum sp. BR 11163]|uniref:FAD/NAD(P)-binding protein n=1 Tax=Nitrospirillum sp. BR 11163 TaxID=3104323 RepID=UPI002AFDE115|nr:FAD/NAD(P)-binding protein [Nitrospirillum sp. BR 11163]MEA1674662.1 FAD/NAD(P)-binding protein [Nitrospirillum sp. BR 11163]
MATNRLPLAVVGGGFSGAATALHLTRRLRDGPPVILFERGGRVGPGLAYATVSPSHLLNVRAANMSAFPDDPSHFERWLADDAGQPGDRHPTEAGLFASRQLYARYLCDTFDEQGGTRAQRIGAEIVDCRRSQDGFVLTSADGAEYQVAAVVLTTGHVAPPPAEDTRHVTDPWDPAWLAGLDPSRPVLIRGTALTMVDIVLTLREVGFGGPVIALSRRGLLPQAHRASPPWPLPTLEPRGRKTVLGVMRRLRREVALAAKEGVDWRAVVDSIRPITAELWQGWDLDERRRFLRHARRWWDVHRHRMAPTVADQLAGELEMGNLRIEKGRLFELKPGSDGVHVAWNGPGGEQRLLCQRVVEAVGLTSMREVRPGLIDRLMARGLARLDPLGIGLDVGDDLSVRGADGTVVSGLWALGPMVRGTFWECIAVPDIRRQAAACAALVAAEQRGK